MYLILYYVSTRGIQGKFLGVMVSDSEQATIDIFSLRPWVRGGCVRCVRLGSWFQTSDFAEVGTNGANLAK